MPYQRLVLTVGTSAFSPANAPHTWRAATDVHGLPPAAAARKLVPPGPLPGDLTRVSAEFSLVHALHKAGRLSAQPHIVLVHSDVGDGPLASHIVGCALQAHFGATITQETASGLDVTNPRVLRGKIGGLLHIVTRHLEAGTPHDTLCGPLGGYKVMTSLGTLVGAILGYPSAYVHEFGQVLHEIPPLPLSLDIARLEDLAPLIRRLAHADVPVPELGPLASLAAENPFLFERERIDAVEVLALNAFGHFLRVNPRTRAAVGPRLMVAADTRAALDGGERAFVRQEVDALLELVLANLSNPATGRGELFHEAPWGVSENGWHIYKGASGRAGVFRAIWRFTPGDDTLALSQVWLHDHDAYERQARTAHARAPSVHLFDHTAALRGA